MPAPLLSRTIVEADQHDTREHRTRRPRRPLELARLQAVAGAAPAMMVLLLPAALAFVALAGHSAWLLSATLLIALTVHGLWAVRRAAPTASLRLAGHTLRAWPWIATGAMALALPALAVLGGLTLADAVTAERTLLLWGVLVVLSIAASLSYSPLPWLSASGATMPLLAATTWSALRGRDIQGDMLAAAGVVCVVGFWLSLCRRRVWRAGLEEVIALQESLRQSELARVEARRSENEKTRFLTIASHDLRQPVHAVGLFAAALDKRLQGTPDEFLVRNVIRAIEGLDRSFSAMLDISRLDANAIEPSVQHFPLRDVFRRLHTQFTGQAELAGLGLRFAPGGKSVSSDPQLLERIVANLVQNALKYTQAGGVIVVARSTATHINVEVWDTGPGIAESELPQIFTEFYQIGHGERDRARGLGMGLAIVKRLVALLGHTLTVTTRVGSGTMFRIGIAHGGLPGIADAAPPADTVPMSVPVAQMVLVVDDEPAIRDGLRILLEEWGCHVITAGNAAEAQDTIRALRSPVDLIISDLHLGPGPDGLDVIEGVRELCGFDVPAMVVTGDTSAEEMRRLSSSGHVVLFKPVQPRTLFAELRALSA